MPVHVYLAGPEVFLPEEELKDITQKKNKICEKYGLVGVSPADGDSKAGSGGMAIYLRDKEAMDSCDAIIANMSPFRSPSGDSGTCFEIGYMRAAGKPCLAYTNTPGLYEERVKPASRKPDGWYDANNMKITSPNMSDNCMMVCACEHSGGTWVCSKEPRDMMDLAAFEVCCERLAQLAAVAPSSAKL